ncbi:hypothetical protein CBL_10767 [Carabus blaptoides fortunei]
MNVPMLAHTTFIRQERLLERTWDEVLTDEIMKYGKIEYEIAVSKNAVENNMAQICVFVDGGWSKRSYGHNYNAASGVASIIGKETKKILFMGVRKKYCSICYVASNLGVEAATPKCYKNWDHSSSGMDADIIVQGFNSSEEMHKLQ